MNYRMLGYLLSLILLIEAGLMILPTIVSFIYGETPLPFLITIGILLTVSLPGVIFRPHDTRIYATEGFVTVAAAWVLLRVSALQVRQPPVWWPRTPASSARF